MTQVLDSSVVVAAFIDVSEVGDWALNALSEGGIAAPHLMPFEAANIIRRTLAHRAIEQHTAFEALGRLRRLTITSLVPFTTAAERTWELRENLTTYDASYVAVAELLDCRLVTLDHRLATAPGPRCPVVTPPPR